VGGPPSGIGLGNTPRKLHYGMDYLVRARERPGNDVLKGPSASLPASRLTRAIPALTVGVVIGVLEVVVASSFAALIFSGELDRHLPAGIGLSLFAAAALLALVAALSSLPHTVASVQDTTAAVFALVAARIAATVPATETFLTVVLAIAVTSVAAGGFFFLLGALRLGNLVRFVPHPVVGGFLAGTGWLLAKGAIGVLSDAPVSLSTLQALVEPAALVKWLPGLGFALLLLVFTRRSSHPLVIPGAVVTGVVVFYAVVLASGGGVEGAEEGGWLLGPFPEAGLWRPWSVEAVGQADWGAVISQAPGMATVLVLGVLTLLLNTSGIELATERDIDLNRELRAAGVANVAAGVGGGIIGFHALSLTALADRAGARSRFVGLVAAAVCAVALLFGGSVLSLFPKPVLGGLLLFLGLAFLFEWVVDARLRLPRTDYLLVLLILVVIGAFGFLQGVAVGLIVALTLFVMEYSREDVVHRALSGEVYRSKVDRNPGHLAVLREQGEAIHILELQGFVFFGTVNSLLERIRDRLEDPSRRPVSHLMLDFRRVNGLDSSAVLGFIKARKLTASRGIHLVVTGLGDRARTQLERGGFDTAEAGVSIFPDLDRGVQWCEDGLLETAGAPPADAPPPLVHLLRASLGEIDPGRLLPYLESLEVPEGHAVMRQREASDGLYFLETGHLTVQFETEDGSRMRLRTVGPGTVVGEVTLYLGTPRTASVIADTPSRMHRLSREALARMEREDPELASAVHRMFARLLAQRLTDSLGEIEALLG
jgi:SulP family sulfate permease